VIGLRKDKKLWPITLYGVASQIFGNLLTLQQERRLKVLSLHGKGLCDISQGAEVDAAIALDVAGADATAWRDGVSLKDQLRMPVPELSRERPFTARPDCQDLVESAFVTWRPLGLVGSTAKLELGRTRVR